MGRKNYGFVDYGTRKIKDDELVLFHAKSYIAKRFFIVALVLAAVAIIVGIFSDNLIYSFYPMMIVSIAGSMSLVLFISSFLIKEYSATITENKLIYRTRIYFWFNYEEIIRARKYRTLGDYMIRTASVHVTVIHTFTDPSGRIIRKSQGFINIRAIKDADAFLVALEQGMELSKQYKSTAKDNKSSKKNLIDKILDGEND